jgi:7-carboxy-7-deazaguanine synthase
MSYAIKEIFYSLQGEGLRAGRPAIFCRFAGCNLWNGREEDRPTAVCQFCDTDFVGTDGTFGGKFRTAQALADSIASQWPAEESHRYVVLTGGEPLLQVDGALIESLHRHQFEIAVETNGTLQVPEGIDWICVSPKAGADWIQRSGDELKLVFPQPGLLPESIESVDFRHHLLQPMDGLMKRQNTVAAVAYCKEHPTWRLSIQTHKLLDIR